MSLRSSFVEEDQGPLISIVARSRSQGNRAVWTMTLRDGRRIVMGGPDQKGFEINQLRKNLQIAMNQACHHYGKGGTGCVLERSREFTHRLFGFGRKFLTDAMPQFEDAGQIDWHDIFSPTKHWDITKPLDFIDFTGPAEALLPIEALPLAGLATARGRINQMEMSELADLWTGFRCQTRRILTTNTGPLTPILGGRHPKLRIAQFRHRNLAGSFRERLFFRQTKGIQPLGGGPRSMETTASVTTRLGTRLAGHCHHHPGDNDITHLSCHSDGKDFYFSTQKARQGMNHQKPHHITGAAISGQSCREGGARPAVFLNACSANFMHSGEFSLVRSLAEGGNPLIIGPETLIPDDDAAFLSQQFYTHFLRGYSAGHALHAAKMELMRQRESLVGMFYTIYGNPDLFLHPSLLNGEVN